MKKEPKIIYYNDEKNDDFANMNINAREIDGSFKYLHSNPLWRAVAGLLYYGIAFPLVWIFERIILRIKFVNKKALKKCRGKHVFLYGNHTGWYDAFTPNLISFPTRCRIIVSRETVSIKGLSTIVQMLGAIPIPTSIYAMKNFSDAVDTHHQKSNIAIFPEAHIWPYYTGVRNFSDASFSYPVKHGVPVIALFTAYTEPKGFLSCFRRANITVYVSDPIYPDASLPARKARTELRNKVYEFMLEKSKLSTYKVCKYVNANTHHTEASEEHEAYVPELEADTCG